MKLDAVSLVEGGLQLFGCCSGQVCCLLLLLLAAVLFCPCLPVWLLAAKSRND
jgi:hypothetical protein